MEHSRIGAETASGRVGVLAGLRAFAGGVGFVVGTPGVWGYALVPAGAFVVLACGLGGLGVWGAGRARDALLGPATTVWGQAGGWLLTGALAVTGVVAALLAALCL